MCPKEMCPLGSGIVTPPFVSRQLHHRLTLNILYHAPFPEHGFLPPVLEPVRQSLPGLYVASARAQLQGLAWP